LNTKENELGRIPQKLRRIGHYCSEGFYELFKAQTLIETFPNYNQIHSKHYELKHNLKSKLKKKERGDVL